MDEHVRVLQARVQAAAVVGSHLRRERARDGDEHEGEEDHHGREHRHDPHRQVARPAPAQQDSSRAVDREQQQPEEERALLAAPEGGERVSERQLVARQLPDVDEAVVVADKGEEQHGRRDGGRDEGEEQRRLRGLGQPAAPCSRGCRAGDERVEREPERDDERGAAELRHLTCSVLAVYFDGHFVTSESFFATNVPLRSSPLTDISRPSRNWSDSDPV